MVKSFNSPEEHARLKAARDTAVKERKDDAALAVSDSQRVATERETNTAKLKALRLSMQATILAPPPPGPGKPKKALRPGQAPNTR